MNTDCATLIPPGGTIGILGGGQLGRMLGLAALKLGLHVHVFCPTPDSPAFEIARQTWQNEYEDRASVEEFARSCDLVTYEFENIPNDTLKIIEDIVTIAPGLKALQISQDRLNEKAFLTTLGIPIAPFMKVDNILELELALERIGHDSILKTRRLGYDGKGQIAIKEASQAKELWQAIGEQPAILEKKISFSREVSLIAVRSPAEFKHYSVCENLHLNQMLRTTRIPAQIPDELKTRAKDTADQIALALDYIGVLAIEMFVVEDKEGMSLMVNEIAPRVHNSGHWTQDACITCQFENHVRAICNWPLGSTRRHSDIVMTNIIGEDALSWENYSSDEDCSLHFYGKNAPRPGRKMGHINHVLPRKDQDRQITSIK